MLYNKKCSLIVIILLAFVSFTLIGCSNDERVQVPTNEDTTIQMSYAEDLSLEDVIIGCSNIVSAKLEEVEDFGEGVYVYKFKVLNNIKNKTREDTIHVYKGETPIFNIGSKYILFLEYAVLPFYPQTIYTNYYELVFEVKDDENLNYYVFGTMQDDSKMNTTKDLVDYINTFKNQFKKSTNTLEDKILLTDDFNEIVANSEYICYIKPKEVTLKNKYVQMVNCKVTKNIKGKLKEDITIQLPIDVELEKEYLVCLQEVDGGSYVISSKHSSISKEDKKTLDKMLKALKDNEALID